MHTIDGDMFYYEGKSHESKRVYVKINGVWVNSNLIMKSGKLTFKSDDWAPIGDLIFHDEKWTNKVSSEKEEKQSNLNYNKSKPPDISDETSTRTRRDEELTKSEMLIIAITNLIVISQIGLITTIKLYWSMFKLYLILFLEIIIFITPTWLVITIKLCWIILKFYWILVNLLLEIIIFLIKLIFW
jgi:hypothetical protein